MSARLLTLFLALSTVWGCGDEHVPDAGGDATVDAGADSGVGPLPSGASLTMPTLPEDPAPVIWACPDGWREVAPRTEGGATVCSPWSADGPLDCPRGEVQLPGDTGCAPLGRACPSGAFPGGTPTPTIFVDPMASPGGSGTESAPFATLDVALGAASAGDVIALGRGEHAIEPAIVPADVTLRGACAAMTTLRTVDGGDTALTLENGATLEDLTVAAAAGAIAVRGTDVSLSAVEIVEAVGPGLSVSRGASITGDRVAIRLSASPSTGVGIAVESDATVALVESIIEEAQVRGVTVAGGGATFTLRDGVIRGTRPLPTGGFGTGLSVSLGGDATLERVAVERNRAAALSIEGAMSRLSISDSVVHDTGPAEGESGDIGIGILFDGGELEARRVAFERCTAMGAQFQAPGQALLEDVLIRSTRPIPEPNSNAGLLGTAIYTEGVTLALVEGRFVDILSNRGLGLESINPDTAVSLTDVRVLDTAPNPCAESTCTEDPGGMGVAAYAGGSLRLERFSIASSGLAGVMIASEGQMDLTTEEVRGSPIGANVQVAGYDISRLQNEVAYTDNETNLAADSLPVPQAAESVDASTMMPESP